MTRKMVGPTPPAPKPTHPLVRVWCSSCPPNDKRMVFAVSGRDDGYEVWIRRFYHVLKFDPADTTERTDIDRSCTETVHAADLVADPGHLPALTRRYFEGVCNEHGQVICFGGDLVEALGSPRAMKGHTVDRYSAPPNRLTTP